MDLNALVITAAACLALAAPLLVFSLTTRAGQQRQRTLATLQRGLVPNGQGVDSADDGQRASAIGRLARRLTPSALLGPLDRWHARAGRPSSWPLERVLVAKLLLAVVVGVLAWLVVSADPSPRAVVVGTGFTLLAWFVPDLLLFNAGQKRAAEIELTLPDTLDQLTIAVNAGLGFESALAHVARNSEGPLADEITRTLQDIQVGQPRRAAYRDLGERADVPDLRRFMQALIQAEQHGVSVARVLSAQAREMRIKRRQRAEETAMKIPVKVVFPLILTILPVLFIVVMGPGVIGIMDSFGGL